MISLFGPPKRPGPVGIGTVSDRLPGERFEPFLDLRMPVREGESTSTIVQRGWEIFPVIVVQEDYEESIVYAIGMLIHESPRHRRPFQRCELGYQLYAVVLWRACATQ